MRSPHRARGAGLRPDRLTSGASDAALRPDRPTSGAYQEQTSGREGLECGEVGAQTRGEADGP